MAFPYPDCVARKKFEESTPPLKVAVPSERILALVFLVPPSICSLMSKPLEAADVLVMSIQPDESIFV